MTLDTVGTIWVRVADPEMVPSVMARAVEMFRNSPAEVTAETEKSFFSSFFGSLQWFVQIILVVTGARRALHRSSSPPTRRAWPSASAAARSRC